MKVWRTKGGEWISAREFMKRWGKGIEGVTPLQQVKSQIVFTWITIVGLFCGLGVSIATWKTLWWLGIILVAGLGNTLIGLIGIYQKYKQLKRIDDMLKNPEVLFENDKMGDKE